MLSSSKTFCKVSDGNNGAGDPPSTTASRLLAEKDQPHKIPQSGLDLNSKFSQGPSDIASTQQTAGSSLGNMASVFPRVEGMDDLSYLIGYGYLLYLWDYRNVG